MRSSQKTALVVASAAGLGLAIFLIARKSSAAATPVQQLPAPQPNYPPPATRPPPTIPSPSIPPLITDTPQFDPFDKLGPFKTGITEEEKQWLRDFGARILG